MRPMPRRADLGDGTAAAPAAALSPVLVVGVGRSGTNLLAAALGADPRFRNAFENRYVWNIGQCTWRHDVRTAADASEPVAAAIRAHFARAAVDGRIVVDKTPSNAFRVPFLAAVFPEARVVNVIRDGRANVASRLRQWNALPGVRTTADAATDTRTNATADAPTRAAAGDGAFCASPGRRSLLATRLRHARDLIARGNVPPSRLPAFLADNAAAFLAHALGGTPRRYGERFPGMTETLAAYGLAVTAAVQWREGVMHAVTAGRALPAGRYLELRYEDLTGAPEATWRRIAAFLAIETEGPGLDFLRRSVADAATRGRTLDASTLAGIEPHIRPTMEFLGYRW